MSEGSLLLRGRVRQGRPATRSQVRRRRLGGPRNRGPALQPHGSPVQARRSAGILFPHPREERDRQSRPLRGKTGLHPVRSHARAHRRVPDEQDHERGLLREALLRGQPREAEHGTPPGIHDRTQDARARGHQGRSHRPAARGQAGSQILEPRRRTQPQAPGQGAQRKGASADRGHLGQRTRPGRGPTQGHRRAVLRSPGHQARPQRSQEARDGRDRRRLPRSQGRQHRDHRQARRPDQEPRDLDRRSTGSRLRHPQQTRQRRQQGQEEKLHAYQARPARRSPGLSQLFHGAPNSPRVCGPSFLFL